MSKMKYRIITYGCQMNKSDSERIATVLENIGYKSALKESGADLILVNMCSVRQSAVDRVYGLIPKFEELREKNQKLKTILTGCILKKDKEKFKKFFDLILDIKTLKDWSKFLSAKSDVIPLPWQRYDVNCSYLEIQPKNQKSFSAFIPISNGCNNFCSFCVVPYVRGPLVCRDHKEILREIKNVIEKKFKEIWLLGQNVNDYQSPTDPTINFPKLLKMVNDIPGNFWIRFTSSHPKNFSDELINTMTKCKKITEYINLPVQSGDNEILEKMNRPYTIEYYKNLIRKIREAFLKNRKGLEKEIAVSTDVIVGFPGETKKQFENTAKLFKKIKFDMAYIAEYSPRPETAAFALEDDVPQKEKERRRKVLTEILKKTALEKNRKYIGKEVEVLVEEKKNKFLIGKTRTHKTVKFLPHTEPKVLLQNGSPQILIGHFVRVEIIDALPWGLKGTKLS